MIHSVDTNWRKLTQIDSIDANWLSLKQINSIDANRLSLKQINSIDANWLSLKQINSIDANRLSLKQINRWQVIGVIVQGLAGFLGTTGNLGAVAVYVSGKAYFWWSEASLS